MDLRYLLNLFNPPHFDDTCSIATDDATPEWGVYTCKSRYYVLVGFHELLLTVGYEGYSLWGSA